MSTRVTIGVSGTLNESERVFNDPLYPSPTSRSSDTEKDLKLRRCVTTQTPRVFVGVVLGPEMRRSRYFLHTLEYVLQSFTLPHEEVPSSIQKRVSIRPVH